MPLLIQTVGYYVFLATVFLLPLFFLPITPEFYEFNKLSLLILSSSILTFALCLSFILEKRVRLVKSPFGLPLLALAGSWIISSLLRSPNRWEAFFDPGQTGTILCLAVFFFTGLNLVRTGKHLDWFLYVFSASMAALSGIVIFFSSGLTSQIALLPPFLKSPLWSPTGNPLATLSSLGLFSLFAIMRILSARNSLHRTKTITLATTLFLSLIASVLTAYRLFSPKSPPPTFLPQSAAWAISLEALKSSPILGTGPATFAADFAKYRPLSFNLSPHWNIRFTSTNNYYLQLTTTLGLLGLAAYLFLVTRTVRTTLTVFHSHPADPALSSIIVSALVTSSLFLLSQLFIPTTTVTLFIFTLLLLLASAGLKLTGSSLVSESDIELVASAETKLRSPLLPWISFFLCLLAIIPALYFTGRLYTAEVLFQKARNFAANNQGRDTYDTMRSAIKLLPTKDNYRLAFSQINLLLANSLAAKKDITADDRNNITQLLQASIREAKTAYALNPQNPASVQNLANTYKSMVGVATGSENWAIESYRQAIILDPINPLLRLNLGGVYFALKNYDEALRLFQSAVDLKPDLANAHYNLAAAYREKGDLAKAVAALQTSVNLVDKTSSDYDRAAKELEDLRAKAGLKVSPTETPPTPETSQLEAPLTLPSPRISPPIELPAELGPEVTGTPAPTPATTPFPTSFPTRP